MYHALGRYLQSLDLDMVEISLGQLGLQAVAYR